VGLTDIVPFLVEDELKAKGGTIRRDPTGRSYVVRDGLLITGQNPASSAAAAALLLHRRRCGDRRRTAGRRPGAQADLHRLHPHRQAAV
jgi:putative intracellular protease/amidase